MDRRPSWGFKPDRIDWGRDWWRVALILVAIVALFLAGSLR
jgi:hypothetical protein